MLIRITRKGLEGGSAWSEGAVHNASLDAAGFSITTRDGAVGLIYKTEAALIKPAQLVGATVSPIDDRWQGWPQGEYTVISADNMGVRVKHQTGRCEGVFVYGLFKMIEPAPKADFTVAEAQRGYKLKFRSGCDVVFVAYVPSAKPHCRLVLLNPSTGNVVTRYENGRADDEPHEHANPGDILVVRS